MRSAAGFHSDEAPRMLEDALELWPRQLLAEENRPVCGSAVQLEHVLCQVDPDDAEFLHGCPLAPLVTSASQAWRIATPLGRERHPPPSLGAQQPGKTTPAVARSVLVREGSTMMRSWQLLRVETPPTLMAFHGADYAGFRRKGGTSRRSQFLSIDTTRRSFCKHRRRLPRR